MSSAVEGMRGLRDDGGEFQGNQLDICKRGLVIVKRGDLLKELRMKTTF